MDDEFVLFPILVLFMLSSSFFFEYEIRVRYVYISSLCVQ